MGRYWKGKTDGGGSDINIFTHISICEIIKKYNKNILGKSESMSTDISHPQPKPLATTQCSLERGSLNEVSFQGSKQGPVQGCTCPEGGALKPLSLLGRGMGWLEGNHQRAWAPTVSLARQHRFLII